MQKKLREIQNKWFNTKADEIQSLADNHDIRGFYQALQVIYGPRHTSPCSLLNADDTQMITEKERILDRWAEHFNKVLNCSAAINDNAIARLPQVELNFNLDASPSEAEVSKAIKQLSGSKAPGDDAIPAEIYKLGGPAIVHRVTELLEAIWSSETVPQQ